MLHTLVKGGLAPLLRLMTRPDVTGTEHLPPTGPVILASNHLSFADSLIIPLVVPRQVTFLAKAEYFQAPGARGAITRHFFQAMGHVSVPRGRGRPALESMRLAQQVLTRGGALGIYPEGTRSLDGRLHRGRTGVARLAVNTGALVIPVGLAGTERVQPVGSRLPRPHQVQVRIGATRRYGQTDGFRPSASALRAITEEIMRDIAALSGQDRVDTYHPSAAR